MTIGSSAATETPVLEQRLVSGWTGVLWVDTGRGSAFRFTLPVAAHT